MRRQVIEGMVLAALGTVATVGGLLVAPATAGESAKSAIAPGLVLPSMNAERGKKLFASKGCVVCHSINGVGGTDAVALDEKTMDPVMSPFDFFAKMWLGAEPMIAMQNEQLGQQIEFTGQDLADIIAFVHNADVQKTFSQADIPGDIKEHMESDKASSGSQMMIEGHGGMVSGKSKGQ